MSKTLKRRTNSKKRLVKRNKKHTNMRKTKNVKRRGGHFPKNYIPPGTAVQGANVTTYQELINDCNGNHCFDIKLHSNDSIVGRGEHTWGILSRQCQNEIVGKNGEKIQCPCIWGSHNQGYGN